MVIPCNLIRLIEIHNTIRIRLNRHTTVRDAAHSASRDRLTSDMSVAATVYSYWSIGKCQSCQSPSVTSPFLFKLLLYPLVKACNRQVKPAKENTHKNTTQLNSKHCTAKQQSLSRRVDGRSLSRIKFTRVTATSSHLCTRYARESAISCWSNDSASRAGR